MKRFSRKLTAYTFPEMRDAQRKAAADANGKFEGFPRLTNDGVLQLVDYWRLSLNRIGGPAAPPYVWPQSEILVRRALGFFKSGDKFNITVAHAGKPFPERLLNVAWNILEVPVKVLDQYSKTPGLKSPVTPIAFRPTAKTRLRVKRLAKKAYARLLHLRALRSGKRKLKVLKRAPTVLPTVVVPGVPAFQTIHFAKRKKKTKPIPWWIWLLLVAVATSNQR